MIDLIKETVLEKLAEDKQTPTQQDAFIQCVSENGVTYKREYIKNGVDRYIIIQETSEKIEYEYMTGSYEQVGEYTRYHQCEWQQVFNWDNSTQSWQKGPEQTKVIDKGTRSDYIDIPRIEATEGKEPIEGKNDGWGFGILWNFYVCYGEEKFKELKKKGYTDREFKKEFDLQRRIAKARSEIQKRNNDEKWKSIKNVIPILSRTPGGKKEARGLIKKYLEDEKWQKFKEQLEEDEREKEEKRRYFPYDRETIEYWRKRERFGLR